MSNIPPQRNPFDRSTPIEAEIIDDVTPHTTGRGHADQWGEHLPGYTHRKRSMLWPLLGWGTAILLLLGFVGGMLTLAIMRAVPDQIAIDETETPALAWEPSEHRAEISTVLDGSWQVAEDDAKYSPVRRLLAQLERASAMGEQEKLIELVDWPRYLARYYQAYRFQPLRGVDRIWLKGAARRGFAMPLNASKFRIASVTEITADDWFVYTYAQEDENVDIAYIFHFHQENNEWKLVDWCEALELTWHSTYGSTNCGPIDDDPAGDEQRKLMNLLLGANARVTNLDYKEAKGMLRQAELLSGIPQLRDSNLHIMAGLWQGMQEYEEALRLYDLAEDPDSEPWLYYLATMCHYNLHNYEQAVLTAEKSEQAAGYHHDVALVKTYCLQQLERNEEAAAEALQLVRHKPAAPEAVELAFSLVPVENYAELFGLLGSGDEALDSYFQQAWTRLYAGDLEGFQAIRDQIAKQAPENTRLLELDADLLHYQGQLEAALAKYREYLAQLKAEGNEEAWEVAWYSMIPIALTLQSHSKLYEESDEKQELLKQLTNGIEFGEAHILERDLAELLSLHREAVPDDPRLPYYTALTARHQLDYATAKAAFQQAIAEFDESEADDYYYLEGLQESLLRVRYEMGEALAAYNEAADQAVAYDSLASAMSDDEAWDELQALNEQHRPPSDGTKLLFRFYQLQLQEAEALATSDQELLSLTLAGYQELQRDNAEAEEIYPYYLRGRINGLVVESDQWFFFLKQYDDPELLFSTLATYFRQHKQPEQLAKLVDYFQQELPESEALFDHKLKQVWDADDYAAYIKQVGDWPPAQINTNYYANLQRKERLVISHLMLGSTAAAWQVASEPEADEDFQILVKMTAADIPALKELLANHTDHSYFVIPPGHEWLAVPQLSEFLQSQAFRRLRSEWAMRPFGLDVSAHAKLLYPEGITWNAANIEQQLKAENLEGIELELMPVSSTSFRLTTPKGECLLTVGNGPLVPDDQLSDHVWRSEQLFVEVAGEHESWLAVELPPESTPELEAFWLRIIAALSDQALVVDVSPSYGSSVMLVTPDQIARFRQGEPLASFTEEKVSGSLPYGSPTHINSLPEQERQWFDKLRKATGTTPTGRVQIAIERGSVVEKVWLKLTDVEHEHWGRYVLYGKMEDDSVLNPYLFAGHLIEVDAGHVLKWED